MTNETIDQGAQDARSADDGLEERASDTRQFVTFITGGEVFAVDMAPVQEILRVPEVVRVPLAPRTLEGLSNLRGRVLPIISLRRIFGFDDQLAGTFSVLGFQFNGPGGLSALRAGNTQFFEFPHTAFVTRAPRLYALAPPRFLFHQLFDFINLILGCFKY